MGPVLIQPIFVSPAWPSGHGHNGKLPLDSGFRRNDGGESGLGEPRRLFVRAIRSDLEPIEQMR